MVLAHVLTQGGPHVEVLIVAAGFLILGITFFVQKSVKPVVSFGLVVLAVVMATGAFVIGGPVAAPQGTSVIFIQPKPGDVVPADKRITLDISVNGAKLASSMQSRDGSHLHVYVDGKVVNMPLTTTPRVRLEPGEHELGVELVDANHYSYKPKVVDRIEVRAREGAPAALP